MAKNRKVLRLGTPVKLSSLLTHLNLIDEDEAAEAIVRHINGELVVEVPQPTLDTEGASEGGE